MRARPLVRWEIHMNRHLPWLVPLLFSSAFVVACSGDGDAPPSAALADGGGDAADAAGDAGDAEDAAADAASDVGSLDDASDAPSGPPRVTISDWKGKPEANVRVVFHDEAGAVIETKLTGADGKATSGGDVLPAMASALFDSGFTREIITWTGLQDGDDIKVRSPVPDIPVDETWAWVTWPDLSAVQGAFDTKVYFGDCTLSGGADDGVGFPDLCGGDSVLVEAVDKNDKVLAHSFKKGITLLTDGVTEVTTSPWKAPKNVKIIGDYPAVALAQIAGGHGFWSEPDDSVAFPVASGFADAIQGVVGWSSKGVARIFMKRVAMTTELSFDAIETLPSIEDARITHTDPRRPRIEWSSSSTAGWDGGFVRVAFYRDEEDVEIFWTFVVAPGSLNVTVPELPPEAAEFGPLEGDEFFYGPAVLFLEGDAIPDYGMVRRELGQLSEPLYRHPPVIPVMPVNGSYRMTWVTQVHQPE